MNDKYKSINFKIKDRHHPIRGFEDFLNECHKNGLELVSHSILLDFDKINCIFTYHDKKSPEICGK